VFGSVRIWNLSNGMLLRNFIPVPGPCEITSVAYHPGESLILPVIAGTNTGKLALWKDFGRIADDTIGQGASIAAIDGLFEPSFMLSDDSASAVQTQRHREEEEALLNLHVNVSGNRLTIERDSRCAPAARLRHRKLVPHPPSRPLMASIGGGEDDDISRFLTRGNTDVPSPKRPTQQRRPVSRPDDARKTAVPKPVNYTSTLTPRMVDALTSPRYLSVEARGVVSNARALIAAEHRVTLRHRHARLPPANPDQPPPKSLQLADHMQSVGEELGVTADMSMDLARDKARGVIAVYGGQASQSELTAALQPSEVPRSHDAIAEEALASFQRLAPHVVPVPAITPIEGTHVHSRRPSLSGPHMPSAGERMRSMQSEVVCVLVGGGIIGENASANVPRTAAWAVSCSSDGGVILWNPTTERPQIIRTLHDTEVGSYHLMQSVITCAHYMPNHGVVAVGTLTGTIHFLSVATGKLLWAGCRSGGLDMPKLPGQGSKYVTAQGDSDESSHTGFFTFPLTPEWNSAKTGASSVIPTPAVLSTGKVTAQPTSAPSAKGRRASVTAEPVPSSNLSIRAVTCMAANSLGSRTLVGYEGGFLRIFDTWQLHGDAWECFEKPVAEWRGHMGRHGVTGADVMTMSHGQEYFVTCGGFDAKIWSTDGHFLALFGQSSPWPSLLLGTHADVSTAHAQAEDMIEGFEAQGVELDRLRLVPHEPIPDKFGAFTFGWRRPVAKENRERADMAGRGTLRVASLTSDQIAGSAPPEHSNALPLPDASYDRRGSVTHLAAARKHSILAEMSRKADPASFVSPPRSMRAVPPRPTAVKSGTEQVAFVQSASADSTSPTESSTAVVTAPTDEKPLVSAPPVDSASLQAALQTQSRKHSIRRAKTETAMEALPSSSQNPFEYHGSGHWVCRDVVTL
jgi:hypothetical protein